MQNIVQIYSVAGLCSDTPVPLDLVDMEPLQCIFLSTSDINKISRHAVQLILQHLDKDCSEKSINEFLGSACNPSAGKGWMTKQLQKDLSSLVHRAHNEIAGASVRVNF